METKRLSEFVQGLYGAMFDDVALEFPALRVEFVRDYKRISSAVDQHGLQFTLITMPDYRKHFDKCLDNGRLTSSHLIHFGSYRSKRPVPRLFKGLILRVFDDNGELRSCPDVRAIFWLRQLLGAARKLKLDCSDQSVWEQTDEFFKTDAAVVSPTSNWDDPTDRSIDLRDLALSDILHDNSRCEQAELFDEFASSPSMELRGTLDTIQCVADILVSSIGSFTATEWDSRHGPGAVAEKLRQGKYSFANWPAKLDLVFPYADWGVSSHSALVDQTPVVSLAQFEHETSARLISVPKTLKAPRLIAAEPVAHQWCQQVIRDYLMTRSSQTLIGSFVAFRRQDLSQEMVRRASIDGSLATADLSAASDRLSCYVVERMFRSVPSAVDAFKAVRTRWMTQELDKFRPKHLLLRKFSTMGSALTFPVQSIVFAAIALGCTLYSQGRSASIYNLRKLRGQVRVFGDDIIVPTPCLELLGNTLHCLGLKVNAAKTFGTGKFRESCGEDAYGGHTVTTINVNEFPRKSAPGAVMSSVDVHNNLYNKGLVNTAAYIRKTVERLGYKFPDVKPSSGALGWSNDIGFDYSRFKKRWNRALHRYEARIHTAKAVVDRVSPGGYPDLLQYFTEAPRVVSSAVSTLGYTVGRPKNKLVLGWAALQQ
jgi:hypothetical protein